MTADWPTNLVPHRTPAAAVGSWYQDDCCSVDGPLSLDFKRRSPPILEIPCKLLPRFVLAGWHPLRRRPLPPGVPASHPAAEVLSRLIGLRVGRCSAGVECATSDIRFSSLDGNPEVDAWAGLLGSTLVGIAEIHHAHGELYIDSSGRCFGHSCIHDAFFFEGSSFGEAVERLLIGRAARPLLRPDQESVTLYGEVFTVEHPAVYRYR